MPPKQPSGSIFISCNSNFLVNKWSLERSVCVSQPDDTIIKQCWWTSPPPDCCVIYKPFIPPSLLLISLNLDFYVECFMTSCVTLHHPVWQHFTLTSIFSIYKQYTDSLNKYVHEYTLSFKGARCNFFTGLKTNKDTELLMQETIVCRS